MKLSVSVVVGHGVLSADGYACVFGPACWPVWVLVFGCVQEDELLVGWLGWVPGDQAGVAGPLLSRCRRISQSSWSG
jgi:hypothetical protein